MQGGGFMVFAKIFILIVSIISFLTACMPPSQGHILTSTDAPPAVSETAMPQPSRTVAPNSTPVSLLLQKNETVRDDCSDMIRGLPAEGLSEVSYVPSGYCFNGEL